MTKQLSIQNELMSKMQPFSVKGKILIWLLTLIFLAGIFAYIYQLKNGLVVTAMRDYVSWGLYISVFIFFIGISHVGALMSAILRLTKAEWRYPITRMAEAITFSSLLFAALMPIFDLGRPDRLLHLLFYGRIQSPILWDVMAILTYFFGSILFLYLPMIPDLALLRDSKKISTVRKFIYSKLSLGWNNLPEQKKLLDKCIGIMTLIIIPIAVSVHTVVSWLFAMTLRPGWSSTIFGPYFVAGAIMSGCAAVIIAMAGFRKAYHLEKYITLKHFQRLSILLLTLALIYFYFNVNEYGVPAYKMERGEKELLTDLFYGKYSWIYWMVQTAGLFIPMVMLAFSAIRKSVPSMVIASVLIVLGSLVKRYLVVIPTLLHPFIPIQNAVKGYGNYFPSAAEWMIVAGSFAGFFLVYIGFSKLFPIVPIVETAENFTIEKSIDE
ncbi:MAG: polysulfide reductase NrfD [Bacteroidetes bacterium]|nr:polysulfide reductase NrfD [Bacteroidota bacterium]